MENVFLDLDPVTYKGDDSVVGNNILSKLSVNASKIGERAKKIKRIGIAYDTPSVAMYDQAKDLFYLGYFASSIIICRSTVEYLAYEIFLEEVSIEGNPETIAQIAESLDFRKIVNDFLYKPKNAENIIEKDARDLFNQIYTTGNMWVHPRTVGEKVNIEEIAYKTLEAMGLLFSSLRDVLKDYDIIQGSLVKKQFKRTKNRLKIPHYLYS